jgi:nickel-type superoxide dismutase maturation protease
MRPAFEAGDRLIVLPVAGVRAGQVVAVRDPRQAARILVKRVHAVSADGVDVRGDNPVESTDSRQFGAVPRNCLVGRVVYRYHPGDRAGRVGG